MKSSNFYERAMKSNILRKKYPKRIPVIIKKSSTKSNLPDINNKKYLVPNDLTLGQFLFVIRKNIQISPETALYIFINNKLLPNSYTMNMAYEENKSEDGFLYIEYTGENTFG